MLKRLNSVADLALVFLLVPLALAAHDVWKQGSDFGSTLPMLMAAPLMGSLAAALGMLVVSPLMPPDRLMFAQAVTLPAIHAVFTSLFARALVTRPSAMVAPHEALSPVAWWLQPCPLLLMVLIEALIVTMLVFFRSRMDEEPVS